MYIRGTVLFVYNRA